MRRAIPYLIIVALLLSVVAAALLGWSGSSSLVEPTYTTGFGGEQLTFQVVYDVGLSVPQAQQVARSTGTHLAVTWFNTSEPRGEIVSQAPYVGAFEPHYTTSVVASLGPLSSSRLPLQKEPPVRPFCQLRLQVAVDGNASPLLCPNGGVNVAAWEYFARMEPWIMTVGRRGSVDDIYAYYCDVLPQKALAKVDQTLPWQYSEAILSNAYDGWRVRRVPSPAVPLTADECLAGSRVVPPTIGGNAVLGSTWGPNQLGYGTATPSVIYNGGDPTGRVWNARWQSWGRSKAVGHGTSLLITNYKTYLGSAVPVPTTVVAWDLGTCQGRRTYLRMEWYPTHGGTWTPIPNEFMCKYPTDW